MNEKAIYDRPSDAVAEDQRPSTPFEEGVVLGFDKPYGWTSFDVVGKVRWALCRYLGVKKLKVGHAGTLDPLATGVMIVCTGRATKQIDELQAHTKEYVATLRIGATTPSFDLEHPIDATYPTEHINRQLVETVLKQFLGRIEQIPPAFSACKVDGKRAYRLARQGKEVELKAKTLIIDEIELIDGPTPFGLTPGLSPNERGTQDGLSITIRVVCSKGTYIRALARDIGQALNSGAHLTALRRTRVGNIRVEECLNVTEWCERLLKSKVESQKSI